MGVKMELLSLIALIGIFGFDGYHAVATSANRVRTKRFGVKEHGFASALTTILIILAVASIFPEIRSFSIIALLSMYAGVEIADKRIPRHISTNKKGASLGRLSISKPL